MLDWLSLHHHHSQALSERSTSAAWLLTAIFLSKGVANSRILEMRKPCISGCEQFASDGEAGSKPRLRTVVPDHQSTVSCAVCLTVDVCLPNLWLHKPIPISLGESWIGLFSMPSNPKRHPNMSLSPVRTQQHDKNSPKSPLFYIACISEYVHSPKAPCKHTGFALCVSSS